MIVYCVSLILSFAINDERFHKIMLPLDFLDAKKVLYSLHPYLIDLMLFFKYVLTA